ncbi:MAG: hypothetical protein LBP61_01825 [Desulfovibrio sp.]|jgi:hypothetical protein|nr:hypothetical protein [Desulfovibrio sp.]
MPDPVLPLPEAGIYAAVRAFVLAYALPALDPAKVIQGWQNRASLPPGTNDYAVIGVSGDRQRGTAVEEYVWKREVPEETGRLAVRGLIEVFVRADFYAGDDTARQRARRLALVTRSSAGVRFFNERGMSALYADDVRDLSFVDESKQFVRRYSTTLHLTLVTGLSLECEAFEAARVSRLENVDAHHKP